MVSSFNGDNYFAFSVTTFLPVFLALMETPFSVFLGRYKIVLCQLRSQLLNYLSFIENRIVLC